MIKYTNAHTSELMADLVVEKLLILSEENAKKNKPFVLALAGGRTPKLVYKKLSLHKDKMQHWILLYSDERFLPDQHPNRNESLFRQAFGEIPHTIKHYPYLTPQDGDLDTAVNHYHQLINTLESIDVCLLGLGEDGHTASLFPKNVSDDMRQKLQPILGISNANKAPALRLSFQYHFIAQCKIILILVTGTAKMAVLNNAIEHNDISLPITHILSLRNVAKKEKLTILLADDDACKDIPAFNYYE